MSNTYYPGCDEIITDPVCSDCPTKELGSVRSIFLQKVGFEFSDITSFAEWSDAICNKNVYVFPYTHGSLEMAEQLSQGFGNVAQDVDSYEFTLNAMEPNYVDNCNFWNDMKRSHQWRVGYRTQSKVHLSDVAALILPKAPIADDLKSKVIWNITFKFIQENIPCPVDMPVGVFEQCIACV